MQRARIALVLSLALFLSTGLADLGLVGEWRFDNVTGEYANDTTMSGLWHFNEGTGTTTNDSSGRGNAGTLSGSPVWNASGRFGSALTFTGANSVDFGNAQNLNFGTGPFTVILWFKNTYVASGQIIYKGNWFNNNAGWGIVAATAPQTIYLLVGNGTYHIEYNTALSNVTDWSSIGLMRDAANKIYYIRNGTITDTGAVVPGNVSNAVNLAVGGSLTGTVDEVAVWNRTLNANEVRSYAGMGRDYSGLGNDGTIIGNASWNSTGRFDYGMTFDGVDDYVFLPKNVITRSSMTTYGATLEAWVKTTVNADWQPIISQNTGTGCSWTCNGGLIINYGYGGGKVSMAVYNNNAYVYSTSTTAVNDGNWHHVAGTYNTNGSIEVYVDGRKENSTYAGDVYASTVISSLIGLHDTLSMSPRFNGTIDEARIYNRTLSQAEIASHAACNYTGSGNWTIDSGKAAFCRSHIDMNGNISVAGNLTLENSDVWMNTSGGRNVAIKIATGGQFYSNNSSINVTDVSYKSYLTTYGASSQTTKIRAYYTNFSNLGQTVGWETRAIWLTHSNDSIFDSCRFNGSANYAILYDGGGGPGTIIRNNVFIGNLYGLYFYSMATLPGVIENNTFIGNSYGLIFDYNTVGTPHMVDNASFLLNAYDTGFMDESNTGCSSIYFRNSNFSSVLFSAFPNCTLRNWVYSKAHGGNATLTKIWGNFSYAPGFPQGRTAGLWHLDDNYSTKADDESFNNNDATTYGGTNWTVGRYGGGVRLDGLDDFLYVTSNSAFNEGTTGATYEMFIKPTNFTSNIHPTLYNRGGQSGIYGYTWIYFSAIVGTSAGITIQYSNGSVPNSWSSTQVVWDPNTWYHVAIVHDKMNKRITFYRNGINIGSNTYTGDLLDPINDISIGTYQGSPSTTYALNVTMDDVRVSSRPLLPSEFLPMEHDTSIIAQTNANVSFTPNVTGVLQNVTLNMSCASATSCNIKIDTNNITINSSTVQASDTSKSYWIGTNSNPFYIMKKIVIDNSRIAGYNGIFYLYSDGVNGTSITNSQLSSPGGGIIFTSISGTTRIIVKNVTVTAAGGGALDVCYATLRPPNATIDQFYADGQYFVTECPADMFVSNARFSYYRGNWISTDKVTCANCSFTDPTTAYYVNASAFFYSKQHNNDPTQTRVWGGFNYTKDWLLTGTVGYWRFDEGSGTSVSDYAGKYNGALVSGPPAWTAGRYGKALSFNGLGQYVDINTSNSLNFTNALTVEAWVYPLVKSGEYRVIVGKGYNIGETFQLRMERTSDGNRVFFDVGTGSSLVSSPAVTLNNSQWHHVAGYFDGKSVGIYVDGVNRGSNPCTGPLAQNTYPLRIGANSMYGGESFNGTIDEVRISNRVLLPSEFLPFEHNATLSEMSGADVRVASDAIVTFDNVTENGTMTVDGALYRYKDFPVLVANGSAVGISGASLNVTDNFTGAFINLTTNSSGYAYPHLFWSSVNNSIITTLKHNVTAGKSGAGWNSVLANSSRGNHTITLGATTGYNVMGNITSSGFTANVTIGGSPLFGPYSGMQPVEIRNGTQIIAKFQHDFSASDLDLNTITVKASGYWVGFSGEYPATLYVPLRGTYCNVRTCAGITNQSETCAAGWTEWSAEPQGWYCLATINGTVAEEQIDPAITRLVAAPLGWWWVAVLFCVAFAVVASVKPKGRRKSRKSG